MGAGGRAGAGPGLLKGKRRLFALSAGKTGRREWWGCWRGEGGEGVMNLHGRGRCLGRCSLSQPRCARQLHPRWPPPLGFPRPHRLPCRCLLPQPPLFASRWVLPDDSRIRCGPRLNALEDQISLWLSGCDGKRLGNGAGELEAREEDRCGKAVAGRPVG